MDRSAWSPGHGRAGRPRVLGNQYRAPGGVQDVWNRSGSSGNEEEISALRIAVRQAHTNNVSIPQCPTLC
jgi:hypothetical protein